MEKLNRRLHYKSKQIIKALRHKPELYNIVLDDNGYAKIEHILKEFNITWNELEFIVDNNDKKRFEFDDLKDKIRASQGHSIEINNDGLLQLTSFKDDEYYYHGTSNDVLESILINGIQKMNRTHVHLSKDIETAKKVALRKDKESNIIIFKIKAKVLASYENIYESSNNVILTRFVPPACINDIIKNVNDIKDNYWNYANIISNKIKTPDGTIIESVFKYDYKEHKDKNGEYYTVDGGLSSLNRTYNKKPAYDISITDAAHFDVIRQHLKWGHKGKKGDQPIQFIKLADMADDHILNVMLHMKGMSKVFKKQFIKELEYRLINNIFISND